MGLEPRLLRACRREPVDCTPVWLMRQAGRYMSEYRSLREKHSLMEMFRTPELAVEVTLQPLKAFSLDAAIIFADILLPLQGMGIDLDFIEGEGPVLRNPIREPAHVEALRPADPHEHLGYVLESLRIVRAEIDGKVPLIGFAGAPFTLAGYMIEGRGSANFLRTKRLMHWEPRAWDRLMSKLVDTLSAYLLAQFRAGAQVIQLFDSWVGCLSPEDYRRFVLPYSQRILSPLKQAGIPSIHFGTGTGGLLPLMREAGGDVVGVDWRIPLDEAWRQLGPSVAVQGNLDPAALMAPLSLLKERIGDVLGRAGGRPGHVFNLGHGVLPQTPVDSVKALVDFVHESSQRR